jgi:putative transposase
MFLVRGIVFSHEAVRDWEAKLTPALVEGMRRRRRGKVGKSWYVDETYIKVHGHWSRCTGTGAISIEPLTATARWST